MRKILLFALSITVFSPAYTQFYKKFRPFAETGINIFANEAFKEQYQTVSVISAGFGFRFEQNTFSKIVPEISYGYSQFMIDSSAFMPKSGSFKIHASNVFLNFSVADNQNIAINLKAGFSGGIFQNNLVNYNYTFTGVTAGISLEKKLFMRSKIYLSLNYNYRKIMEINMLRDIDTKEIKMGIIL